jgi:hypothetical protein
VGFTETRIERPEAAATRMDRVRAALLLLIEVASLGLVAELLLLDHKETFSQWLPLAVLALVIVAGVAVAVRPTALPIRLFQALMIGVFITGMVGIYLHYRSNVEFELEMYPTLGGWQLIWQSLKGAIPALAPGALAQLGLLGLVFTLGHPGLRAPRADARPSTDTAGDRR